MNLENWTNPLKEEIRRLLVEKNDEHREQRNDESEDAA